MTRPAHQQPGPAARLQGVAHRYPGERAGALDGIDLTVAAGEVVALVGSSGAGKSTLLTLLDGRLRDWQGGAEVLGHRLDARRPPKRALRAEVGFVFQEFALIDRATVRQNVLNGRLGRVPVLASLLGRFGDADHEAALAAMSDTGIAELADKRADQLSGGQRQRVGIARALAQEPRLLLADEPVASLDPARAEAILTLLAASARRRGATLVFSSHQPAIAAAVADRVVALRAGRVVLDAPPRQLSDAALAPVYAAEQPAAEPPVETRLAG